MMRRVVLALLVGAVVAAAVAVLHAGDPSAGPSEGVPQAAPATDEGTSLPAGRADDAPLRARARAATADASADVGPAPQGSVTGTVVCAGDAAPVAGADVRWWAVAAPMRLPQETENSAVVGDALDAPPRGGTTTDAAGRFALDVPPGERWQLVVTAAGSGPVMECGVGAADLRLLLLPGAAIRWVVVEGASDRPVPGAVVRAFDRRTNGVPLGTFPCDAAGRGEAALGGPADLLFSAGGFASRWMTLVPGDEVTHEVPLAAAAAIAGEVVDAAGRAVAGARVGCSGFATGEPWPLVLPTDGDGRFRFVVADDGDTHTLWGEAEGFALAQVEAAPGETNVRILLHPAAWIEGTVVDARGAVPEGFVAECDGVPGRVTGPGTFEIGPLPPGVREIEVESDRDGDKAWGQTVVALRPGERRTGVRIVLAEPPPSTATRVRVTDPAGTRVRGVMVFWQDRPWTQQRTDADGLATIRAPGPPGRSGMLATATVGLPGRVHGPAVEAVARAREDDAVVELTVLPASRVAVRVLGPDGGDFAAGDLQVGVRTATSVRQDGALLWIADGAQFDLSVRADGLAPCTIPCTADQVVDGVLTVRLPRGPFVRGRVAVVGDALPMRLRVVGTVVRGPRDRVSASVDVADGDGTFALSGLPPGEGALEVRCADELLGIFPLSVGTADLDLGVVRIGPFVRLHGSVVDDRGFGVPRAAVRVVSEARLSRGAETDAAGRFEILFPEGMRVRVSASRDDDLASVPLEIEAARDTAPLTLRLERTARVLVLASFAEENGVSVRIRPAAGGAELERGRSTWGARPPAFGVQVPPGAWDLCVRFEGREWTRPLTVGPGDVAEVTLDE